MNYAAIDIGTNSCRLLVAQIQAGKLRPLARGLESSRLGEGTAHNRVLAPAAMERTIASLRNFQAIIAQHQPGQVMAAATSAVREADNRATFLAMVREQCGLKVRVLDGEEEAAFSYQAVVQALRLAAPPLVVDLGGGSSEFVFAPGEPELIVSLPLGAVRAAEENFAYAEMVRRLEPVRLRRSEFEGSPLVMVGGTVTTLVAIDKALAVYRPEEVHGQVLTRETIRILYHRLINLPLEERRQLAGLQPERADIIPAGALIVLAIMETLGFEELIVSESDLLEGMIWSLAGQEGR